MEGKTWYRLYALGGVLKLLIAAALIVLGIILIVQSVKEVCDPCWSTRTNGACTPEDQKKCINAARGVKITIGVFALIAAGLMLIASVLTFWGSARNHRGISAAAMVFDYLAFVTALVFGIVAIVVSSAIRMVCNDDALCQDTDMSSENVCVQNASNGYKCLMMKGRNSAPDDVTCWSPSQEEKVCSMASIALAISIILLVGAALELFAAVWASFIVCCAKEERVAVPVAVPVVREDIPVVRTFQHGTTTTTVTQPMPGPRVPSSRV